MNNNDEKTKESGKGKGKGHNKLNILGQRFGQLTAIRDTGERKSDCVVWEFRCDCGNIFYATTNSVRTGHTRSCGCVKRKYRTNQSHDLTGKKFGYLTVIKEVEIDRSKEENKKQRANFLWLCQCDCGNFVEDVTNAIISGNRTSCGCMYRSPELFKKAQEASGKFNGTLISQLKSKKVWETNTSGVRGVCPGKNGKWRAYIVFKRKSISLGQYDTIEKAAEARKRGEERYFGEAIEEYEDMLKSENEV
jgi:hypothetical protein